MDGRQDASLPPAELPAEVSAESQANRTKVTPLPQGGFETLALQRVGAMVEIPRVLREMNVDPDPLLEKAGIDRTVLANIDGKLPFSAVSDLILKCIEATGRNDFPLVVGSSARLDHLGIIGKLLSASPTVGSALVDFASNHPRYVRGATTYLVDQGEDGLMLAHRVHSPGLRGSVAFSIGAIAFGRAIFAELAGVEPARALLSLPKPVDTSPYRKAFGRAKLVFDAEHFGLVYSRAALAKTVPGADPGRHAEIRKFITGQWNFLQPDLLDRVMRVLVPLVLAGTPSLKTTADLLIMHPRTLNRALESRGMSFRDAVNEARFEMASQFLRETRVSIRDLSRILGYSEVSAFTRFFTNAVGMPPSEWKRQERQRADV